MKETDPVTRHHGRAENGGDAGGCSRAQGVPTLPGSVPVTASHVSLLCIKVTLYLPCCCALMLPHGHKPVDPNQVTPKTPEHSQMLPWVKNISIKSSE